MNNKIFCTAPFTTLRIESYSGDSADEQRSNLGIVFKPGCVYDPGHPIPSLKDYLDGEEMEKHRDNLCHGTVPKQNCHKCSEVEKNGLQSVRMHLLKKPWASDQKKIKMLDIFFSNVCNLGCVMCLPDVSSFASNERFQAGILPRPIRLQNNIDIALDSMDNLPDLESVSFIGGEFFMVKENARILEKIIERDLTCTIHTNATIMDPNLLSLLEQIKKLELRMSIDGVQDVYEFIRYPAKWAQFQDNVKFLSQKFPNAEKFFSIVIQPLNAHNLHETFAWANKQMILTHYQIIESPRHLSWEIMTDREKKMLFDLLIDKNNQPFHITAQQKTLIKDLAASLDRIQFSPQSRSKGIDFLSKLLKIRKINPDQIRGTLGYLDQFSEDIIQAMS